MMMHNCGDFPNNSPSRKRELTPGGRIQLTAVRGHHTDLTLTAEAAAKRMPVKENRSIKRCFRAMSMRDMFYTFALLVFPPEITVIDRAGIGKVSHMHFQIRTH